MPEATTPDSGDQAVETQAGGQTPQQQLQIRIDESKMQTTYSNGVLTKNTPEEVILDFGFQSPAPPAQQGDAPQMQLQISQRIILSYHSAKRLAITLSRLIQRHEERFGELELDVAKRQKTQPGN